MSRVIQAGILTAVVVMGGANPVWADESIPDVTTWDGTSGDVNTDTLRDIDINSIRDIDLPDPEPLDTTSTDGGDTVVRLQTDILFAFGKATLVSQARPQIKTLVAKVPKNASVHVDGYTDSIGDDASNRSLSLARAKAVAAAIRTSRPDLKLAVKGLGEQDPVADNTSNGKDNPAGRAKNRRVELRYQS